METHTIRDAYFPKQNNKEYNDDDENLNLSKGIKIWMAFNRECYFSIKALFLI